MNETEFFYTLKEAAVALRRSPKSVTRLIKDGQLSRDPTTCRVLIPRVDVDGFIARRGKAIALISAKK